MSSSEEEVALPKSKPTEKGNAALFSDDDDEISDVETKAPTVSDDKKAAADDGGSDNGEDMADLFGSDYESEEEFKASGIKEDPVRDTDRDSPEPTSTNSSTASTRAFNGSNTREVDDVHHDELSIPKGPKAPKKTNLFFTRPPNVLRFVPDAFTTESIKKEKEETGDEGIYRNYVRWRYKLDASGRIMVDPKTGLPMRETNSRIVKWEDGSFTMCVGDEVLTLTQQKVANSFVFVNEQSTDETVLECHGRVKSKLTIRPISTASSSHQSLKMSMRARHNKAVVRIQEYVSEIDGTLDKEQRAAVKQEQMRLENRKKQRQGYEYDRDRSSRLDSSFLEEGYEDEDDNNLSAIKQQYGHKAKNKATSAASRRAAPRPGGLDEYRQQKQEQRHRAVEVDDDDDEDDEDMIPHTSASKRRRTVDEDSD
ncbi:hypothetical protein H310_14578 [Aphanomyces invadans]|uniref:Leo1-like protein n=1 Tax=Aphanomyces invadans TaxID=157072 RepID=A0A024T9K4_9STRA|nr:hypothetical protein H310_14578 [Aphanomyces invadans]ETV90684.1 hypothetical protein H310_14578 [Aphanomyces invadans]|eukprot:XP_008880681.1 hypothetical protein H310_14578 [Aphanomyces invadans]